MRDRDAAVTQRAWIESGSENKNLVKGDQHR